jgi:hypothetical protein
MSRHSHFRRELRGESLIRFSIRVIRSTHPISISALCADEAKMRLGGLRLTMTADGKSF